MQQAYSEARFMLNAVSLVQGCEVKKNVSVLSVKAPQVVVVSGVKHYSTTYFWPADPVQRWGQYCT